MSDNNLPAVYDGFDETEVNARLIQGARIDCNVLDTAAPWKNPDDTPVDADAEWLVTGIHEAIQRWRDGQCETTHKQPGVPLPSVKELNAGVPASEWETNKFTGEPRPPYEHVWVVYLVDLATCDRRTFVSGTVGAKIAWEELRDRVAWMRRLRGERVLPIIRLGIGSFLTRKFGVRPRPTFLPNRWIGPAITMPAPQIEHTPAPTNEYAAAKEGLVPGYPDDHGGNVSNKKLKKVDPPTTAEDLDDKIPF
jgi:hypothetical protein